MTNPLNEFVVVTPSQGILVDGAATVTVNVGTVVQDATLSVTITPPVLEGVDATGANTAEIKLSRI